jgi:desumoylating isopeptidase 1
VKEILSDTVIPYLKSRFAPAIQQNQPPSATPAILTSWAQVTSDLAAVLPPTSLFPLVDLWRLALLDPVVGKWISSSSSSNDPIKMFLDKCSNDPTTVRKSNYTLTLLRLLANTFYTPTLSRRLFTTYKWGMTRDVLIPSFLDENRLVRTAAASLAFNAAGWIHRGRVGSVQGTGVGSVDEGKEGKLEDEEDGEWEDEEDGEWEDEEDGGWEDEEDGGWEVEMVTMIVKEIRQEGSSEDVGRWLFLIFTFWENGLI